jgi:hypothetical protein
MRRTAGSGTNCGLSGEFGGGTELAIQARAHGAGHGELRREQWTANLFDHLGDG